MARRVVLGVAGGIAAYKAVLLLRLLAEAGHEVRVVPTPAALAFIGAPTWAALSGHPVAADVWDDVHEVPHVRIGREAELLVVAPATADLLARAAHGLADDLLTNVLLTARCPVLLAPAMHTEMWAHPATVANVALLRARGVHVLEPASGRLTGADSGPGRLPEPAEIAAAALALLAPGEVEVAGPVGGSLAGVSVVVSAGGTREPIDPVRFIGNRSSGRQGVALARVAAARGAKVTLVAGTVEVPLPVPLPRPLPGTETGAQANPADDRGIDVVRVSTADEMRCAVESAAAAADVVVMAAAVADFRPAEVAEHKIKKSDDGDDTPVVRLIRNPDILAGLVARRRPGQIIVGFAAETGDASHDIIEHARAKLVRKGVDLLVLNDVSAGKVFGRDDTEVTLLHPGGALTPLPPGSKTHVAGEVWDAIAALLGGVPGSSDRRIEAGDG